MSIAQLMFFSECNVRNVIFRFFFTHLGKGRGNSNWFPFGHVLLITETSQTIRNGILNKDQLEMKYMLVSGGSILLLAETIENHKCGSRRAGGGGGGGGGGGFRTALENHKLYGFL